MANLIENAKLQIDSLLKDAHKRAAEAGQLPEGELNGIVEIPKDTKNGDYAANHAMAGAKALHMAPRKIAEALCANIELDGSYFQSVEIAGPGFLNFRLGSRWYADVLSDIEAEGADYGRSDYGRGQRVMVEFVSANPTGPMHMGNARGGVLGDTLANVLDLAGYSAWKEFYVNDAGNQINKFAVSINARYMQLILGEDGFEFPEEGYHGEDIKALARGIYEENGDSWKELAEEERLERMAAYGLKHNIPAMQADLRRYGIEYDEWFFESELHNSGYVAETVDLLTQKGWTFEKDGALWLNTSALLREKAVRDGKTPEQAEKLDLKDDVLRRANGFYTYFAADIAYHRNKFEKRGFDKVINVWGADHHGHVARLQAALDGLGLDGSNRLVIVLMQLVNLLQDGKPVRMSKRTGKAIALHDLLDEISVDAARYYFNNRIATSPLDFDLDLAVRQDSENPVYYVQYAHARICSLLANMAAEGHTVPSCRDADLSLLTDEHELELIKQLSALPEEIRLAARDYDPSRINRYVVELSARFHRFYTACRLKDAEPDVRSARLVLADSVRKVIAASLAIVGVSAPEKM
ncbi:MAG: arginine--tRNA ligase [Candidatus Heteroscillospira sp.]|jgi:arginyl-tRNA synthetase